MMLKLLSFELSVSFHQTYHFQGFFVTALRRQIGEGAALRYFCHSFVKVPRPWHCILVVPYHSLFIRHLKLGSYQICHFHMLIFYHGVFFAHLSHQLKVLVLVEFYLVLITLHLIQKFLCSLRGLDHSIDIALIVTHQTIVMLSQLVQVCFINLYFCFDIVLSSLLLWIDKHLIKSFVFCFHFKQFIYAFLDEIVNFFD